MEYREIAPGELDRALFRHFERRQEVTKCRRRENGVWVVRDAPFIDDWSEADYAFLVQCLQNTLATGGVVLGAFAGGALKGFASVESAPLGKAGDYRDLTCLHVSAELRGRGIGRELFTRAAQWARAHGGKKLYLSAHSAVETQAFYAAMGCVEAREYNEAHVASEPFDCQMEYAL